MEKRIGFVGPGRMGSGMIKNLLKHNFKVTIFRHRSGLDLDRFIDLGASVTSSLSELSAKSNTIMLTLPSSVEVEQRISGEGGLLYHLRPNSVVIDHSTSFPASTRKIAAKLKEKEISMLDAPMTGGPGHADRGELNLMVGGDRDVYEEYLDVFRCIAENIFYVGPNGSGHTVKLINNFLGLLNVGAISEILPLASKCGVDLDALYSVILVSGGYSRAFDRNVPLICRRNFDITFELRLAHKDLKYVSQLGREYNVPLPIANSALHAYDLAMAHGLGNENANSIVKMWEEFADATVEAEGKPVPNDGRGGD